MDVGNLPNHVKYCVSVLYPPLSNYQYTPGPRMGVPEFPNRKCMKKTSGKICCTENLMMAFLTTWMRQNMIWFVRVVLYLHSAKDDPKVFAVVKTVEDGSWTLSHKSNWPASYKK